VRINRLIAPLTAATVAVLTLFGQAAHAELLINVDKSSQRMTVTVNGEHLYDWPVTTGGSGYDTPSGTFKPFRMEIDHYSDEYDNAPMPCGWRIANYAAIGIWKRPRQLVCNLKIVKILLTRCAAISCSLQFFGSSLLVALGRNPSNWLSHNDFQLRGRSALPAFHQNLPANSLLQGGEHPEISFRLLCVRANRKIPCLHQDLEK
jgi:L,D-transpeptidase catalytic domain